jgi:hypothetical protein
VERGVWSVRPQSRRERGQYDRGKVQGKAVNVGGEEDITPMMGNENVEKCRQARVRLCIDQSIYWNDALRCLQFDRAATSSRSETDNRWPGQSRLFQVLVLAAILIAIA